MAGDCLRKTRVMTLMLLAAKENRRFLRCCVLAFNRGEIWRTYKVRKQIPIIDTFVFYKRVGNQAVVSNTTSVFVQSVERTFSLSYVEGCILIYLASFVDSSALNALRILLCWFELTF